MSEAFAKTSLKDGINRINTAQQDQGRTKFATLNTDPYRATISQNSMRNGSNKIRVDDNCMSTREGSIGFNPFGFDTKFNSNEKPENRKKVVFAAKKLNIRGDGTLDPTGLEQKLQRFAYKVILDG